MKKYRYIVGSGRIYDKEGLIKYLNRYLRKKSVIFFYDTEEHIRYRACDAYGGYLIQRWNDEWEES